MTRILAPRQRASAVAAALLAAFGVAYLMPIPSLPDPGRAIVRAEVRERLPGWSIRRLDPSWEGGYTVVTSCAAREMSFQFVPGHGLPAQDAWLHPTNEYARERLESVSDHYRHLLWRADPRREQSLSCADEMARSDQPSADRNLD